MNSNMMSVPPLSWLAHSLATLSQLVPGCSGDSSHKQSCPGGRLGKGDQLLTLRDEEQALACLCLLLQMQVSVHKMD